jgi:hypothetical protein
MSEDVLKNENNRLSWNTEIREDIEITVEYLKIIIIIIIIIINIIIIAWDCPAAWIIPKKVS